MKVLALDTENDIYNKGNPYDSRFNSVCWSYADADGSGVHRSNEEGIGELRKIATGDRLLVGFNWKYDLAVFRKLAVDLSGYKCWDCQLAEFVISHQTERYPSLEGCLVKYDLGHKVDVVKEEYWNKGITTKDIPWGILSNYAEVDAQKTLALYHKQMEVMTREQVHLVNLMCMDLVVLQEMEWNGLVFDKELCDTRAAEIKIKISEIDERLRSVYPDVPINFNSGDQLSAFLYGGIVKEEAKDHIGFFKTGERAGQPKYKNVIIEHQLPRLVSPVRGSETSKEGVWQTNAPTLQKLKPNKKVKHILDLLFEQAKCITLNQNYYVGLPKINEEMHWPTNMLHGQFQQVVAQTGRLSSAKPNLQNFASSIQDILISRYDN